MVRRGWCWIVVRVRVEWSVQWSVVDMVLPSSGIRQGKKGIDERLVP